MRRFEDQAPSGLLVQQWEGLLRAALFKPANALVGYLLQAAADRIDAAYQPKLTKASRCATGNRPPTFPVWTRSMSSGRYCGARPYAAGWERPRIHASRRLGDFWKYRLNQHAARNDTLPLAA